MSKTLSKYSKIGTLKGEMLSGSTFFKNKNYFSFEVPILNLAASGSFDHGLCRGITTIAAPPKHFKSSFHLMGMRSFLKHHEGKDPVIWFYDNEFGTPLEYFEARGVDMDRVLHLPFRSLEDLRNDMFQKLEQVDPEEEQIMIVVDSLGQATSKKQQDDAKKDENKADLQRPKLIKDFCRLVAPAITIANVPSIFINHTYTSQDMYKPGEVISGGTGIIYASDTVWTIKKVNDKDEKTKEVLGNEFIIDIAFSRQVKERSKFTVYVDYETGVDPYSGILELMEEFGIVVPNGKGYYSLANDMEKKYRLKALRDNVDDVLARHLNDPEFRKMVENKYKLTKSKDEETVVIQP